MLVCVLLMALWNTVRKPFKSTQQTTCDSRAQVATNCVAGQFACSIFSSFSFYFLPRRRREKTLQDKMKTWAEAAQRTRLEIENVKWEKKCKIRTTRRFWVMWFQSEVSTVGLWFRGNTVIKLPLFPHLSWNWKLDSLNMFGSHWC